MEVDNENTAFLIMRYMRICLLDEDDGHHDVLHRACVYILFSPRDLANHKMKLAEHIFDSLPHHSRTVPLVFADANVPSRLTG
jgi:hypothetical protein